ncbi:MAG: prolipoprotein diacylglyceryl transferase, partial [Bacteroidetes bacterium]
AASYVLRKELERKTKEGLLRPVTKEVKVGEKASVSELTINGVIGFLLGFKLLLVILNYSDFVDNPQEFILSGKGNLIGGIVGAAIAAYIKWKEKEKQRLPKPKIEKIQVQPQDLVGNITMIAAVSGLIGAKIFHLLENPDEIPYMFSGGAAAFFSGLTMYGGLIFGAIAVLYYCKKQGFNILHVMDAAAPALMLAYGIGRLGCQLAGDGDWGIVNTLPKPEVLAFLPDWFWAYDYPHNVINEGVPIPGCEGKYCTHLPQPVFPTPLYESIVSIGMFGLLWSIRKKINIAGKLFSIYLIFNGFERFWIEKIRVNSVYHIMDMEVTQAEIISLILMIAGIAGLFYFNKQKDKNELQGTHPTSN